MELGKCIIDSPKNIRITDLHKAYDMSNDRLEVLKGLDLKVEQGEMIAIMGQSGAGKSTLLHIIGALDHPTSGSIHFGDLDLFKLGRGPLADYRRSSIGFIFQFHNLLPEFSALENVMMPQRIHGTYADDDFGKELLDLVGLNGRFNHHPSELSGGERQRVAIARALVNQPQIVLADEPTGNLDSNTGTMVFNLIEKIQAKKKHTFILATHNVKLASKCDRVLRLENGTLKLINGNYV